MDLYLRQRRAARAVQLAAAGGARVRADAGARGAHADAGVSAHARAVRTLRAPALPAESGCAAAASRAAHRPRARARPPPARRPQRLPRAAGALAPTFPHSHISASRTGSQTLSINRLLGARVTSHCEEYRLKCHGSYENQLQEALNADAGRLCELLEHLRTAERSDVSVVLPQLRLQSQLDFASPLAPAAPSTGRAVHTSTLLRQCLVDGARS